MPVSDYFEFSPVRITPYSSFTHLPPTLYDLSIWQPRNNPEERRPHPHRGISLKSRKLRASLHNILRKERFYVPPWCTTIHAPTYFLLRRYPSRPFSSSLSKEAIFYDCSMGKEQKGLMFHELLNVQPQTLPSWTRPVTQWKAIRFVIFNLTQNLQEELYKMTISALRVRRV